MADNDISDFRDIGMIVHQKHTINSSSRRLRHQFLCQALFALLVFVVVTVLLFLGWPNCCNYYYSHHIEISQGMDKNANNDDMDDDIDLWNKIHTPPTGYNNPNDDGHTIDPQPFDFDAVFGDNMVLQYGRNTKAAIYGFLGPSCSDVELFVYDNSANNKNKIYFHTTHAMINVTQQPFGTKGKWGIRPCSKHDCPGKYDMKPFNPWNMPLPTWKILLPPQPNPGGNYTIQAKCIEQHHKNVLSKLKDNTPTTIQITNITYGDVWYCSGQSNMWLPISFTFHRNETMDAIINDNKYHNIHLMAGPSSNVPYGKDPNHWNPGYGKVGGTNPWMTAYQAVTQNFKTPNNIQTSPLTTFGATCWYFGQKLVDMGFHSDIPIGLMNTAIGGQRIQEFMDNSTIDLCHNRTSPMQPIVERWWESQLYATQVLPFADMTIKGWIWYQGENNMHDIKGNAQQHIGYGCELPLLVKSWRDVWSTIPQTTDPLAPFGVVTLASSGTEGGPDIGTMRLAQTGNYGVLPSPDIPNSFIAQAHDLDDPWGPDLGLCFEKQCCDVPQRNRGKYNRTTCSNETLYQICQNGACAAANGTPTFMGGIHPRSKKWVGDRLGIAAFNLVYGGNDAITGPTLQGCSIQQDNPNVLEVRFNASLLRGEELVVLPFPPNTTTPDRYKRPSGGSQLWVQTNASLFCMEPTLCDNSDSRHPKYCCDSWAGGSQITPQKVDRGVLDQGWIRLNYSAAIHTKHAIHVDLSPLHGAKPTAIRYAWGIINCCDLKDPNLYVTHGCIANCPIQSSKNQLPANPFMAKIVDGKCECVAPQVCSDDKDDETFLAVEGQPLEEI